MLLWLTHMMPKPFPNPRRHWRMYSRAPGHAGNRMGSICHTCGRAHVRGKHTLGTWFIPSPATTLGPPPGHDVLEIGVTTAIEHPGSAVMAGYVTFTHRTATPSPVPARFIPSSPHNKAQKSWERRWATRKIVRGEGEQSGLGGGKLFHESWLHAV